MDFLKRELAPITANGWKEIEERATAVLSKELSARKFVRVTGPLGREVTSITTGRMDVKTKDDIKYGVYKVQPLTESRICFPLSRWELDNIERGAKDVDYTSLDEGVRKAAKFEEEAIFKGLEEGQIEGIYKSSSYDTLDFGKTADKTLKVIFEGILKLDAAFAKKPYVLVVSNEKWYYLNTIVKEYSLPEKLEKILGHKIIVSKSIDGAILLPFDDENIELIIGEDYALGYQNHNESVVELFITESFSFRVLDPALIVLFK
ncbi:family 1 encapsulin nanocompartment shell protein [Fusobacterium sp.]|uniref:family 1 encapsulin nanocompartment shell protein n=1 Tax=Fusobacterium sp. TaxID=68766 RepID=UPI002901A63B|nr:family 1 encapsulin nanocompartment shell protein [Fusobacterium sp.]MDU1911395.1 family 1 encapsulin nanocompartment shell protein [Fusobacterium sp.]